MPWAWKTNAVNISACRVLDSLGLEQEGLGRSTWGRETCIGIQIVLFATLLCHWIFMALSLGGRCSPV